MSQARFDAHDCKAFGEPSEGKRELSPDELARIRQVQQRLPEQQRQRGKKVAGGKVDRKALRDRS